MPKKCRHDNIIFFNVLHKGFHACVTQFAYTVLLGYCDTVGTKETFHNLQMSQFNSMKLSFVFSMVDKKNYRNKQFATISVVTNHNKNYREGL